MKAILLDGSQETGGTGKRVRAALTAQLQAQGWDSEHIVLREKKIGPCAGDFFCWIRSPGVCNVNDDNRAIAAAIVASDLMVYLTPVTFGGYSSALKSMVDHQIQNISPFFANVEGETHHHKRYQKHPDFLAVGWMEAPDEHSEAVFRHLLQRNALNFYAKKNVSGVIFANQTDEEILTSAQKWLDELRNGQPSQQVDLPINGDPPTALGVGTGEGSVEVRRALLLVGSPKTRKSTSNSVGAYLYEQLSARSVQTETIYPHTVLRSPAKMQALLDAVDAADLVTLTFPLYVDSLPAPVIEALECIAAHRQGRDPSHRQLFTAIANSGFPEAHHNATALAICATFARQAGFEWAGSLALGGGGMVNGVPLAEGGGKTLGIRKSLELAAEALAQGQAIPQAAQDVMARPVMPPWAYRLTGDLGWIWAARGYRALKQLKRQPYLEKTKQHRP
ncbi:MAG TPA: NAD(P)H-dependent oxidoreductase [Anaerolineae bacterium]|nr:NAD(P)H-dependent oxidoreductase [Anaerolineae bacterium]